MPRRPRVESSGGLYHVINRGNYRSYIFDTDVARFSFAKALDEACVRFSWELSAYCLMGNHYHLCVGTPLGNLSSGMRWLQATFAYRFNRYRKESGVGMGEANIASERESKCEYAQKLRKLNVTH